MGSIAPDDADQPALLETIERPLGPAAVKKLNGWQLFEKMGRPKFVVAVRLKIFCVYI